MKTYTVRIHLQQEEDGRWSVWAPDLPGCASWGHSQEEALTNIQEAAALYIESLIARVLPIPSGVAASDQPAVTINVTAA